MPGKNTEIIGNFYLQFLEKWNISHLLLETIFAIIATAFLIALYVILRTLSKRVFRFIESWRGTRIHSLRFQSLELISATQVTNVLLNLVKALRVFNGKDNPCYKDSYY